MILVAGGTGLVGSHLLLRLAEGGNSVRALYRSEASIKKTRSLFKGYNKSLLFKNIEWIHGDITDIPSLESSFENIEYVYHCAALISFDPNDEELLRKINIEGTANIVNFCLQYKIRKLCYVSSVSALGDLKEHETVITEETEWNPEKEHSDYAISKYGAEMEIWRGQQEGLTSIVVNPGIILGPGFWHNGSGKIFSEIKKGLKYFTKGRTGFVNVKDVVNSMTILMRSEIKNERFIVVAQNLTFEEVLTGIAEALEVKPPTIYANHFMTLLASKGDWIRCGIFGGKRRLSKDSVRSLHSQNVYSNAKIKDAVGYQFEDVKTAIGEIILLQKKITESAAHPD